MLSKALRCVDAASLALAWVGAGLIAAVTALIVTEVVLRAAFNFSLAFAWEVSSFGAGLGMVLGIPYTFRTGGHVRVSLVHGWLRPDSARRLDHAVMIVAVAVLVWVAYAVAQMTASSYRNDAVSFATGIPLFLPQMVIAAGFAVAAVQLAAMLVHEIWSGQTEIMAVRNGVE